MIKITAPSPGESIIHVVISTWLKNNNSFVYKDDEIAEIESEKATLTITAPVDGILVIKVDAGATVNVGDIIAEIEPKVSSAKHMASNEISTDKKLDNLNNQKTNIFEQTVKITPLAKKIIEVNSIDLGKIKNKKIIKAYDVLDYLSQNKRRSYRKEPLSQLRKKLSERLVSVKNETATLTTFNEVDMKNILDLRKKEGESFKNKYSVKLGLMSFFAYAASKALIEFPQVNAQISNDDILFFNYVDLSIAVQTDKGLMVPVLRNAELMTIPEIEISINSLAEKARNKKLSLDEMQGGTFTITNGGVFGSLLSTPIINPPQTAILGMHNIVERPVAINSQVVIRPMMYLALSYDHRLIDGKDSVLFLKKIKELVENPETYF